MRRSVDAGPGGARDAAEAEDGVRRLVAASVGPYGAVLADGSEYRGDYGLLRRGPARLPPAARLEVLATAGADLLAIETIPSEQEATVLLQVLDEMPEGTAGVAVAHLRRRGDDPARVSDVDRVFGLARGSTTGSSPSASTAPRPSTSRSWCRGRSSASGKPAVAYPNSGEAGTAPPAAGAGTAPVVDAGRGGPLGGGRGEVRRWLLPGRRRGHRPAGRHDAGQRAGQRPRPRLSRVASRSSSRRSSRWAPAARPRNRAATTAQLSRTRGVAVRPRRRGTGTG